MKQIKEDKEMMQCCKKVPVESISVVYPLIDEWGRRERESDYMCMKRERRLNGKFVFCLPL